MGLFMLKTNKQLNKKNCWWEGHHLGLVLRNYESSRLDPA